MPPDPEPPPILGSWNRIYALVIGLLLFWIAVFAAFTAQYRSFS